MSNPRCLCGLTLVRHFAPACPCGGFIPAVPTVSEVEKIPLWRAVRTLMRTMPKCVCGAMATVDVLVPHEYTYAACDTCAKDRLERPDAFESGMPQPYLESLRALVALVPGGPEELAELCRERTDAERDAFVAARDAAQTEKMS